MFGLTRTIVRVGVIGALATGGLAMIAGPERVGALFHQAKNCVNDKIDKAITDPVALRAQLRELEASYPRRIEQAENDLREVRGQMAQLNRESNVSEMVVEMAAKDLEGLQTLITQAESARGSIANVSYGDNEPRRVEILFNDQRLSVDAAYTKTAEITNTRTAHMARAGDIQRDLGYLTKQESRLGSLVSKLKGEQAEFQVQLWQLDRQVDSIARNDRMIEVLAKRQESIEEQSRYKAASLDHLQNKVADIRAKQEAELAALAAGQERTDYEHKAKMALDSANARTSLQEAARAKAARKDQVIEIRALPGTGHSPAPLAAPSPTKSEPVKSVNASPVG